MINDQSHALGSQHPTLEPSLGTHQAATLITQPKASQLSSSINTTGIVSVTKDKDLESLFFMFTITNHSRPFRFLIQSHYPF